MTGLADSANFVGFYDMNGFEVRVAANWRDEYLLQFGQNQNTGAFGAEPTFVNSSLQIDLSTSYQLTDAAQRVLRGVERHERDDEHARPLRQRAARRVCLRSPLRLGCALPDVTSARGGVDE